MGKQIDITGKKFNKLTAIRFVERKIDYYYWLFKCDCGNEIIIRKASVLNGKTKACGCSRYNVWTDKKRPGHSVKMSGKNNPMFGVKRLGVDNPNWRGGKEKCSKENYKKQWEKIKNNPRLKLRQKISGLINKKLKRRLINKNHKSTFKDILPYTVDDLMKHLELLFEPWMNWSNHGYGEGKWSIDHKIPDSSFNYKSVEDEEFKRCWALENLQPMDWHENLFKNDKLNYDRTTYTSIASSNINNVL